MKTLNQAYLFLIALLFFAVEPMALTFYSSTDKRNLSLDMPPEYENYAHKGSYLNPTWVGENPEWNFYDVFGNHLVDGYYIFAMSLQGDATTNTEQSQIVLHQILKKWFNGMVQVGDMNDNRGVLAMVGDRVATQFTPYTFNQTLFSGARIDVFFNLLYGVNSLSIINSRISNIGIYIAGETQDSFPSRNADWLHGIHMNKKIKDNFDIGATLLDLRNQVYGKSGSLDGTRDSLFPNSATALQIYGLDGRCNLPRLKAYGEWAQSQEVIGGDFRPKPGNVVTLNALGDISDKLKLGGEGYVVESKYKTTFDDPSIPNPIGSGRYPYSLVEDNDDRDLFPENGVNARLNVFQYGDPDGVIPQKYDKNKNNMYDWEEDFLNYDADPPKSGLYFDRNNNGIPDDIEDDAYPDFPYVPSYYLPGERYLRQDDKTGKWIDAKVPVIFGNGMICDSLMKNLVSKGLSGFHLYGKYQILPQLTLSLGGMYEQSEKNSYQMNYQDTKPVGSIYAPEKATTLYSLIQYQNAFAEDKKLTVDNYFRYVQDNIPNHTVTNFIGFDSANLKNSMMYAYVPDQLEYRDAMVEMLVAQYDIFRNRGFNLTSRAKYEFTKQVPHLDFNYTDASISSLILVNKCEYIWLLPFFKDMFLIPKYKNIYELDDYGPGSDSLMDYRYRHNSMSNNAYLVYEWKFTPKTSIATGYQFEVFNDFLDPLETYYHGNWTLQLMIKDRYSGLNVILTTGVAKYFYDFYNSHEIQHNPYNNPYRITNDISSYYLFLKVHCGF
jgi:hypothetical protein